MVRHPRDGPLPKATTNELYEGGAERVHDGLELGVEVREEELEVVNVGDDRRATRDR